MNAQELHDRLEYEHRAGLRWLFSSDSKERETILRALRLLAAAEANDGTTPETDASLIPGEHDERGTIECVEADFARRLELERNGLAARVLELEPDAERWDALAEIWCHAVELSLTQDEDGAWSITIVEPVEATIGHGRWTGDTPETAIDVARGSRP